MRLMPNAHHFFLFYSFAVWAAYGEESMSFWKLGSQGKVG